MNYSGMQESLKNLNAILSRKQGFITIQQGEK